VLFLDEPTIGLDPHTRAHIWDYIVRLRLEGKVTIFLTTHYMDEAERLCDRIAIIDHGRIIAEGTPEELKRLVGGDMVYLRLKSPVPNACSILDLPKIVEECKTLRDGRIALKVSNAAEAIPVILEAARSRGLQVSEVSYHRPSLNDVFLYLTGRELRDEEVSGLESLWMKARVLMRRGRL
jgi:ABC-2 type transport system ATP-binding protein